MSQLIKLTQFIQLHLPRARTLFLPWRFFSFHVSFLRLKVLIINELQRWNIKINVSLQISMFQSHLFHQGLITSSYVLKFSSQVLKFSSQGFGNSSEKVKNETLKHKNETLKHKMKHWSAMFHFLNAWFSIKWNIKVKHET